MSPVNYSIKTGVLKIMESSQQQLKLVRSEELISRFRSKADLYKYLTEQGKLTLRHVFNE